MKFGIDQVRIDIEDVELQIKNAERFIGKIEYYISYAFKDSQT